jgi:hypothetical protein
MEKTGLKDNATKDSQTYYEICMEENQPLLGSQSGESADLREELAFLKRTNENGLRFETRIDSRDIGRLLRKSKSAPEEWIALQVNLRFVTEH